MGKKIIGASLLLISMVNLISCNYANYPLNKEHYAEIYDKIKNRFLQYNDVFIDLVDDQTFTINKSFEYTYDHRNYETVEGKYELNFANGYSMRCHHEYYYDEGELIDLSFFEIYSETVSSLAEVFFYPETLTWLNSFYKLYAEIEIEIYPYVRDAAFNFNLLRQDYLSVDVKNENEETINFSLRYYDYRTYYAELSF